MLAFHRVDNWRHFGAPTVTIHNQEPRETKAAGERADPEGQVNVTGH
jgi:hypothetical protein